MIDPTKSQLIPPPKEEKKKDADHERLLKEQEEALVKFAQQKKEEEEAKKRKDEDRIKKDEDERKRRLDEEVQRRVEEAKEQRKREELERKIREEVERAKREEAEKKLKEEAVRKLREDEKRIMEEAERRVKEQMYLEEVQKKLKEEAEKKIQEEVEKKLKESQEKKDLESSKKIEEHKKSKEEENMKFIYEQRLEELKAKLAEAEKKIDAVKSKDMAPVPPKVSVYNDAETEAKANEIKIFLLEKGIKEEEIRVMNGSGNIELIGAVKQQRGDKFQFPVAIINNIIVGNIDDIKAYNVEGILDDIIAGKNAHLPSKKGTTAPPELQIGFIDGTINLAEWTIYGLGTLVLLPVIAPYKFLTWAFGSKKPELEAGVDIDVIHTNWYYRHQLRTFRFTEENVFRLRPGYNDVRAVHKYEEIALLDRVDATNVIISYKDKSSPDYIRAPPNDVKRIRDIVLKNSKVKPQLKGWEEQ